MPPGNASGVNHTTAPPSLGLGGAPETAGAGEWGILENGNREGPKTDIQELDKAGLVEFQNLSRIFLLRRLRISKPRYNPSCLSG